MSGPSTLVLCRTCGWERPYEWFLVPVGGELVTTQVGGDNPFQRVKECRACRDRWDEQTADDQYDTWQTRP